ncbi:MAG: AraC family transcriptional regulator [Rariglobus sp.]
MLSSPTRWTVKTQYPCWRLDCPRGWDRPREHSLRLGDMELWLVRKGHGWMKTKTQEFSLMPGFCVLMRPGGIYDAGQDDERPLGITFIHFNVQMTEKNQEVACPAAELTAWPEFYQLGDIDYLDAVTRRIVHLASRKPDVADQLLKGVLLDILQRPSLNDNSPSSHYLHESSISAMVAEVQSGTGDLPDVAAMARRTGLSQAHFSRTFHKITGQSPRDFLLHTRMTQARHLLTGTELSINEIAERLGYADIFFFSRQFKEKVGLPPSAYRKQALG